MQNFITINQRQIPLLLKKHHLAKRMTLRYHPHKNCISISLPRRSSVQSALKFAAEKSQWIEAQLLKSQQSTPVNLCNGATIPILGELVSIRHLGGRGLDNLAQGILYIHGAEEFLPRRVRTWLQKKCAAEIAKHAHNFCHNTNTKYRKINLRDTSSRWGSCSSSGNLSFSWRLVFAPSEVLEYVVAHEVAHLKEHNHSPAFWSIVAKLCPEFQKQKSWLKQHGRNLHYF